MSVKNVMGGKTIDSSAVKGEAGTGFEKRGSKGAFECGNCEYFKANSCGQKDMMAKSKQPRTQNGRVVVAADDCCDYIQRSSKKKSKEN